VHILLLEDNEADVFLFREALLTCPVSAELTAVLDAEHGVELLRQAHFKPDLIVVDLNLSLMSGHDFLRECCSIVDGPPCVAFSSSLNEKDRSPSLQAIQFWPWEKSKWSKNATSKTLINVPATNKKEQITGRILNPKSRSEIEAKASFRSPWPLFTESASLGRG